MKTDKPTIEERLTKSAPTLSSHTRGVLWNRIEKRIRVAPTVTTTSTPVPSPYTHFVSLRYAVSFVLLLALIVSTGGVVYASEPARPGDFLFPVDRAVEEVRLALARGEGAREALLRDIGNERLIELRSIIDEESEVRRESDNASTLIASGTVPRFLTLEADIFADVTTITIELDERKTYRTTDARNEADIIAFIKGEYPFLTEDMIREALTIEHEDRMSRPQDRGEVTLRESGRARVDEALMIALPLLTAESSHQDSLRQRLEEEVRGLDIDIDDDTFRVKDGKKRYEWKYDDDDDEDSDERIKYRNGDERVRIEEKHGEVRIRIESDDDEGESERTRLEIPNYTITDDEDDEDEKDEDEDNHRGKDDEQEDEDENDEEDHSGSGSGHNDDDDDEEEDDDDEEEDEDEDEDEEDTV